MNLLNLSKRLFWSFLPQHCFCIFLSWAFLLFLLHPCQFSQPLVFNQLHHANANGHSCNHPLLPLGLCTLAFTALQILSFYTLVIFPAFSTWVSALHPISRFPSTNTLACLCCESFSLFHHHSQISPPREGNSS